LEDIRHLPLEESAYSVRNKALAALAPHLTQSLIGEGLEVLRASAPHYSIDETLVAFAPHLSSNLINQALQIARDCRDITPLASLVPYLPQAERPIVLSEVFSRVLPLWTDDSHSASEVWQNISPIFIGSFRFEDLTAILARAGTIPRPLLMEMLVAFLPVVARTGLRMATLMRTFCDVVKCIP
jgi:hypothetical protein